MSKATQFWPNWEYELGKKVAPQKNVVLIYIYSDGTKKRVPEFE